MLLAVASGMVKVMYGFSIDLEPNLAAIVRQRIQEKNIERGIASTLGYLSTLVALSICNGCVLACATKYAAGRNQ